MGTVSSFPFPFFPNPLGELSIRMPCRIVAAFECNLFESIYKRHVMDAAAHGGDDDTMSDVSLQLLMAFCICVATIRYRHTHSSSAHTHLRSSVCSFNKIALRSPSLNKLICQNQFLLADRYARNHILAFPRSSVMAFNTFSPFYSVAI